ncbi:MAG: DUF309 domain-containing protein [Dehalococcoidia bacterium]|nr:DUF309 domain-containing protein [Dehalococcoidia bacterium]
MTDAPAARDVPWPPPSPQPKPLRPRDELGRPLPAGAATRLVLPNFDAMTAEACHAEAIRLFEARNYFGAHEAWETCWVQRKGTEEEEFFKGLAQLGAGYTHWARGNAHGAAALLGRALDRMGVLGSPHRGLDIARFMRDVEALRATAEACAASDAPLTPLDAPLAPRA